MLSRNLVSESNMPKVKVFQKIMPKLSYGTVRPPSKGMRRGNMIWDLAMPKVTAFQKMMSKR